MKILTLNILFLGFATLCHAGLLFQYHELTLMDLDQMTKLVQDKLKESKKANAKTVPLKEGLQAVYSRPDADRMIDKVITPLRMELQDLDQYDRIINELTDEALNALKNTRNFKPSVQVTYAIFLENLMGDARRLAESEDNLERKLLKKIKKAGIKVTKEAANERKVRTLNESRSPSDIANDLLDGIEKMEKENAEAKKLAAEKAAKEKPKEEEKK
jgi:hypothetical protein